MAITSYFHGVEVQFLDSDIYPISVRRTSVIGLVGTAPEANATDFPLDTPVLINSQAGFSRIGGTGTLPGAFAQIYAEAGAVVVAIRVEEGAAEADTLANIKGGVDANGARTGAYAFLDSLGLTGFVPKILIAPGFTHQRSDDGILSVSMAAGDGVVQGAGYIVAPEVVISGGGGSGATATAVLGTGADSGKVVEIIINDPGEDYATAPTVSIAAAPQDGTNAVAGTVATGEVRNRAAGILLSIAHRLLATIVIDGENGPNLIANAAQLNAEWSERVFAVEPWVLVNGASKPPSPSIAGLINRIDNTRGYWWSPSNQELFGIEGTSVKVDWHESDTSSTANLMNEQNCSTIIRDDGFRLWGNRMLGGIGSYNFLSVRRTADIVAEAIMAAHRRFVDRPITPGFLEDVLESVNLFMDQLKAREAIADGRVWYDPDLNNAADIAAGHVTFSYEIGPFTPAERITFRASVNTKLTADVLAASVAQ